MSAADRPRYCIVGAGYYGIAVARELKATGIEYDQFDQNSDIGGNWMFNTYDSVKTVTSKYSMEFDDAAIPSHYSLFPGRQEIWEYLKQYVENNGLRDNIHFNCRVTKLEPLGTNGEEGWLVHFEYGRPKRYQGVILSTGHSWHKNMPSISQDFMGHQIHSTDYRNSKSIKGHKVLVVGAKASGCDIASELAGLGYNVSIVTRSSWHYLPKSVLGLAIYDIDRLWLPRKIRELIIRFGLMLCAHRHPTSLPRTQSGPLKKPPVVSDKFLRHIHENAITVKSAMVSLKDQSVTFNDGSNSNYDSIIWATGFKAKLPDLPADFAMGRRKIPLLIEQLLLPEYANLYLPGFMRVRCGTGKVASRTAQIVTKMILIQEKIDRPLVKLLSKTDSKPQPPIDKGGGSVLRRLIKTELKLVRLRLTTKLLNVNE